MLLTHSHVDVYLVIALAVTALLKRASPDPLRIFIAVGVRLYREGLAEVLRQRADISIAAVQPAAAEAVAFVVALKPDVVLLDMATRHSLTIGRDLQRSAPGVSVIGLGVGETEAEMLACAEVGITGFVSHQASLEELIAVMKSAAQGEAICSPQLAGRLVRRLAALSAERPLESPQVRLTSRERQIAALIERNLSNKDIANTLGIEVATVKNHVHSLLQKLSVHRRSEAVALLGRERRLIAQD
jgi:DNA-binding NarL/FixJ family response regulator